MASIPNQDFLCLIPARGGSKGVPGKNIKPLAGKPLIAWTIEQALACKYLSRVIVSTDSGAVAETARTFGAEVPFMRPAHLAEDATPTWPVLRHAVEETEKQTGKKVEAVVLLQPTSPLRKTADIDGAIERFQQQSCQAVFSVSPSKNNPYYNMVELNAAGYLEQCKAIDPPPARRQDAPEVYVLNGAVYVYKREVLFLYETFSHLKQVIPYIIPRERSLDVDTFDDFEAAEKWLGA